MASQIYLKKYFNFFLLMAIVVILFTSCSKKMSAGGAGTNPPPTGGTKLNVLCIESDSFLKLRNNKIIFQFSFDSNNELTLKGWGAGGPLRHSYNTGRVIELKKACVASVAYGPHTILSNVILQKAQKIRRLLKSDTSMHYVLFYPQIKDGSVSYNVKIADTKPQTLTALNVNATQVGELNPSPPKNY